MGQNSIYMLGFMCYAHREVIIARNQSTYGSDVAREPVVYMHLCARIYRD